MVQSTLNRVDQLREFEGRAHRLDTNDEATFRTFVGDARIILEKSEADIADLLGISRPTLNRWINGRSIPHPLMRPAVLSKILSQVTAKLSILASYSRGSQSSESYSGEGGMVAKSYGE
jgi:hypothetical protein